MSVSVDGLEQALLQGASALGVDLQPHQRRQLLDYLALIGKWSRVYNLTAIRSPEEMLTHHLLDSLAVVEPLRRHAAGRPLRVLDVGSGAGLPGVVLAICCPEFAVDCVDTVAKKAAFVQHVAASLRLPALRGVHARVESMGASYDLVCSRAFASLQDFVALTQARLAPGGAWMAMKGRRPEDEIAAVSPRAQVFHVEPLTIPALDAERCIVWMRPREVLT
ncbi:16S rRNA (guanine(527)-N(7))-methyltransferase RsmG [Ramlibacter rhizophilus]|uniref:Ribosomal RNA small subunit methyltransferase G n=1 Tax=Ramlibacter rhizophilus TaxID=1781167 RepID=A0A4Z0BGR9_9BURK|nr:16S rRNA (guanine(527)-N(7))-methyltransferase RsmG [Ramlibacter rhizophilus]TFY97990.1 16S rRNA (guanine(527)-N(7))-methyltransferase RsmG [Ramlibacter rhizophilus]